MTSTLVLMPSRTITASHPLRRRDVAVILAWRTRQDKRGEPRWQTVPMPPMSDVAIVGRASSIPPALVDVLARSGADLFVAGVVLAWVPLVLVLDRSATLGVQHLLGLGTWALLVALLSREDPLVRAQTAVVVVFATAVEYTFSPLLEVYVYRLDNVPAYVPPGHGLVYLCAFTLGRSTVFRAYARQLVVLTMLIGGAYAGWGLVVSDRPDVLGAFWYGCLVGFLLYGGRGCSTSVRSSS